MQIINFNIYSTLVCMVCVLLLGRLIIKKVKFLQDYNIPEPIVGGVIAAVLILILYKSFHFELKFDGSLKDPLILIFFTSIGLSADFASLKKGGKMLVIFLIAVGVLVIMQNIVGVAIAEAMGVNPLIGMLGGSITMSGGHGTGGVWAEFFKKEPYNFSPAMEIAMASATFGLVSGGIIGGPVARYLIKKYNLKTPGVEDKENNVAPAGFEAPQKERLITASSFVESLGLFAASIFIGSLLDDAFKSIGTKVNLPTFVWCLFVGVILRNVLSGLKIHKVFDREVAMLGNVSLSLFLAFALMTINLWELVALAVPLVTILVCQVVMMFFYAVFVTFRACGGDYDAAVIAAGHCGFGLGATPTAMANMQTVTNHYGYSHTAFLVVPLVGAFFVDIINASVISTFLQLPIFH